MSLPHCDGCRSTDIFYDFNFAGTTKDGVNAASHHVVTGWLLTSDAYNNITFARTSNRVQWLTGNMTWARFSPSEVKTRAPNGDCSIGSHPAYCWRFDTSTTRDSSGAVVAWEVTKPSVSSLNATPAAQRTVLRSKVDQNRLQECIENDASQCMDTVPGLRDCVQKRLVCNETAAIESSTRMRASALTAQDAKTAAVDFLLARKALSGDAETVSAKDNGTTVTVSITGAVSELTGDRRSHERAELTYDRASHALLSVHMSFSRIRFDSAGAVAGKHHGAVFTDHIPTYDLLAIADEKGTRGQIMESARHIDDALHHPERTFPSYVGKSVPGGSFDQPLHRMVDETLNNRNRNASGPVCRDVWGGDYDAARYNCDEYPFASTYEGAYTSTNEGQNVATWSGSARPIWYQDNQRSGNYLTTQFYTVHRVLDGDAFVVRMQL